MRLEFGVVQLPERVLHILVAHVLDAASAVFEDVGVAHVPGLPHVVLEILPAARGRETRHGDAVLAPTRGCGAASAATSTSAAAARSSVAAGELDAELVAVIVVAVAGVHGVVGVPEKKITRNELGSPL